MKVIEFQAVQVSTSTSMIRASRPFIDSKMRKFDSISCSLCLTSWSFFGIDEEDDDDAAVRLAARSDRSFIMSTM